MESKWHGVSVCLILAATACARENASESITTSSTVSVTTAATGAAPAPLKNPARPTQVRIRIDRRVVDPGTAGFEAVVEATLTDPRGWRRADFEFTFGDDAPFTVVLAEGHLVDELCRPYDVGGRFSCQIGPVVALNADRWREATPQWPGNRDLYRQMLINHEVGHLLGQHHPAHQCPAPGERAPVMAQQSTELGSCLPNAWPLPWEIACATRHSEPLAPGYEADPTAACGPRHRPPRRGRQPGLQGTGVGRLLRSNPA